jgi:hypothetical protein
MWLRLAWLGALLSAAGCGPPAASTAPDRIPPAAPSASRAEKAMPPAPAPGPAPSPTPPPQSLGYLKGQTHVHSARSYDAHTPPEQVLEFYRAHGYDFVALTDHNRVTVVEPPSGLLLVPGVELTQNSAVCEPKPAPGYRCLFHLSGLFVDPEQDVAHGEKIQIPFHPGRLDAYRSEVEIVRKLGGVAVLNHPLFHFAADARTVRALAEDGVRFLEIVNASLDAQHPAGARDAEDRSEALWDEVLSSGTLVYALASDDAHHFADAADRVRHGKFAYVGDRAFVMVRAEKNIASVRAAMLAGRFYASTGVVLDRVDAVDDGRVTLHVVADGARRYVTRFVGKGGKELARVEGESPSYSPHGDEGYVRAVVEGSAGARAWTQPVMLRSAKDR